MWTKHIALLAAVLALAPASVTAEEPTASDLIALAPDIISLNAKCRSIEISGYFIQGDSVFLNFRALYRAPDKYALLLSDGVDGTPLLFAADRKMLFYDPVTPAVYYETDISPRLLIWRDEHTLKFDWGCSNEENKDGMILVDAKSLLNGARTEDKVVKTGDRKYRLTITSAKGNFLVSDIDLASANPYSKIELINKDEKKPFFCINKLRVNESTKDDEFTIPPKEQTSERISVREWPNIGTVEKRSGFESLMLRSFYARLGANQPEFRKEIENQSINFPGASGIDWDKVRENDKKFSRVLRDLVPSGHKMP